MTVQVVWDGGDEPQFVVDRTLDGFVVRAHPSLSQVQVRLACDHLDGDGEAVYQAWASAAGIDRRTG